MGERAKNLKSYLSLPEQLWRYIPLEAFPMDWAMAQNNLGIVYGDRIRGDRAENLEQAILHYKLALKVYTNEAFPVDWAEYFIIILRQLI